MRLHTLKATPGANTKPVRKGRGTGSGLGKTAGRGQTGQNSRSGGGVRLGFEGGQMPLTRRVPKRGFSNYWFRKDEKGVNLERLAAFKTGETVTLETLKEKKIVNSKTEYVKILGGGEIKTALTVKGLKVSKSAAEKIAAAGGKVEEN